MNGSARGVACSARARRVEPPAGRRMVIGMTNPADTARAAADCLPYRDLLRSRSGRASRRLGRRSAVGSCTRPYLRPMSLRFGFDDLHGRHFPFEIRLYGKVGRLLWHQRVDGPSVLRVAAFPGRVGRCELTLPNGAVESHQSRG